MLTTLWLMAMTTTLGGGGFAQNVKEHLTSRPSRSKNTDNHVDAVSAGHGQTEYDSLPFFETDSEMNAENIPKTILDELHFKNTKRKLKGLRKFYDKKSKKAHAL